MLRYLTITIIFIFGLSCSSTKESNIYEICVYRNGDTSTIVKNDIIGISDTMTVFLSGKVIDMKSKDILMSAIVSLKDSETGKLYGKFTDTLGQFSMNVPAGDYFFEVIFAGYSLLNKDLKLGIGEIREIDIELGQGGGFVTYEIKSEKKLSRKQLNEIRDKLKIKNK